MTTIQADVESTTVQFPEAITIATVGELRDALDPVVNGDATSVALDLGSVQRIDAAGVQLLAALLRSLAELGASVELQNISDEVERACRDTGWARLVTRQRPKTSEWRPRRDSVRHPHWVVILTRKGERESWRGRRKGRAPELRF